ncbi:pilus protein PilZ [Geomonas limicola]|uniref:Pilus protein PilZ n=1 Tax=Geomonas limicola TaxID=2740186 RepID=A0A6V8N9K5_9BACT|nr:PilZ domain-containing protein [Geomonas limicola]GFO68487.1 pilus protein PilZ [Geomonas limicola]
MTQARILIIAKDPEAGHAYAEALREIHVDYDIAGSFTEMAELATDNSYNGLLVDILTLVRSSKEEKVVAYECFNLYPVLRVKWENKKKKINLSPLEQAFSPDTASALKFFVQSRCIPFPARPLRRYNRKNYNLNVLLSPDGRFADENTLKTFTLNISLGGAFLHSTHDFAQGETVWLRFVEYPDHEPIRASVRWYLEWGQSRSIPGLGVRFEGLSEAQEHLVKLIANG